MPKPFFANHNKVTEIVRVNHAGEYGAKRIYEGQIAALKNQADKNLINDMLEHELEHLEYFTNQLHILKIRPTFLLSFWHVGGYILGRLSASVSINTAMLTTQAVEEVIEKHYNSQLTILDGSLTEIDLANNIKKFRDEEIEHKNIAKNYNNNSLFSSIGSFIIKKICTGAIFLSKKI